MDFRFSDSVPAEGIRAARAKPAFVRRGREGLEEIGPLWRELDERTSSPTQQSIWSRSFLISQNLTASATLVASMDESGQTAAVAPLVFSRGKLAMPGAEELGEPMDFAHAAEPASLASLCHRLARLPFPVHIDRIALHSPTIAALKRAYRSRGVVLVRPARPYPHLPLDGSWVDPLSRLSPRRRSDMRRARRNAEKMGVVSFAFASPNVDEVGPLVAEAFRVESESWKGRAGTALLRDAKLKSFFEMYTREAARLGSLRIAFLSIGGRAAAMQLAVVHARRYWLLKIGYDEAFAHGSPGLLLLAESIRRSAEEGLSSYEFLGGVAPWIKVWTPHERACVSVSAYPASLPGFWSLGARMMRRAIADMRGR